MKRLCVKKLLGLLGVIGVALAGCGGGGGGGGGNGNSNTVPYSEPAALGVVVTPAFAPTTSDTVSLATGTTSYSHTRYSLNADGSLASITRSQSDTETYDTWVLENQFLRVTLVPEMGGRVLSIVNKTTNHEQLYQTDYGYVFGNHAGNFLYDWLMVYGGIFPTFGPEHGKAWFSPWALTVETNTAEEVTVAMRWTDNSVVDTPSNFSVYADATGLELTYRVTLKAGRAALDTRIEIHNPGASSQPLEYWTCTTLAPGSTIGDPRTTANAEIIYPLDFVSSAAWCPSSSECAGTMANGTPVTYGPDPSLSPLFLRLDDLRFFGNWPGLGIFYAEPDMANRNFWGVINHDNEEGIIRIATNQFTRGMKFWTWGYEPTLNVDPTETERRPYIELWAGSSQQFFSTQPIGPGATMSQGEVYAATVGLTAVTHANDNFLTRFRRVGGDVHADITSLFPGVDLDYALVQNGTEFATGTISPTATAPSTITAPIPIAGSGAIDLILRFGSDTVFTATID
jgi:hypothetical protein